jgi:hypothetical protein
MEITMMKYLQIFISGLCFVTGADAFLRGEIADGFICLALGLINFLLAKRHFDAERNNQ